MGMGLRKGIEEEGEGEEGGEGRLECVREGGV